MDRKIAWGVLGVILFIGITVAVECVHYYQHTRYHERMVIRYERALEAANDSIAAEIDSMRVGRDEQ